MQLCRTDTDDFYDEWNENVKEYSLNLPSFDTNKDVLLYIKDSELVYKKTNETTSGREHLKSVQYEDRYCFKLNDFLYILIASFKLSYFVILPFSRINALLHSNCNPNIL